MKSDSREIDGKGVQFLPRKDCPSCFDSGVILPSCFSLRKTGPKHSSSAQVVFSLTWFTMSGFDDPGVYYSDSFGGGEVSGVDEGGQKRIQIKKRFREFLRQFRVGTDRTGFTYKYR